MKLNYTLFVVAMLCSCVSPPVSGPTEPGVRLYHRVRDGHVCSILYFEVHAAEWDLAHSFAVAFEMLQRDRTVTRDRRLEFLAKATHFFPDDHHDKLAPLLWQALHDPDQDIKRLATAIGVEWYGSYPTNHLSLPDDYFDPEKHPKILEQIEAMSRNESENWARPQQSVAPATSEPAALQAPASEAGER